MNDDGDGGSEEVLDLYRGTVQGSTLFAELELVVGDGTDVEWQNAGALEVSIRRSV